MRSGLPNRFLSASFLLLIVSLVPVSPARAQAVVEHFVGAPGGPGIRDGVGAEVRFNTPTGVWANTTDVYVSDQSNATIRKISIDSGVVSTIAGTPQQKGQVDGNRDQARFSGPGPLWGDGTFLYVIDASLVRKVDPVTGTVSLFAPAPPYPPGQVFLGPQPGMITGNSTDVYVVDGPALFGSSYIPEGYATLRKISLASGQVQSVPFPTSISGPQRTPNGIWADDHFLYVSYADTSVSPGQVGLGRMDLSTLQFEGVPGFPLPLGSFFNGGHFIAAGLSWVDTKGNLFFLDFQKVYKFAPSTMQPSIVAMVPGQTSDNIGGLWGTGNVLFATDSVSNTILEIDLTNSTMATIAGLANPPLTGIPNAATLAGVQGMWSDGKFVYAADTAQNLIHKIDIVSGADTTFVSNIHGPVGIWGDAESLYVTQPGDNLLARISLSSAQSSTLASGFSANAVTGDSTYLYVSTTWQILRVTKATGDVMAFAGGAGSFRYADGVGTNASFYQIYGLWTEGTAIYVADGTTVRVVIIATQQVGTFAGTGGTFAMKDGVATNASFAGVKTITGDTTDIYFGDSGHAIRRISRSTAQVTTILSTIPQSGVQPAIYDPIALWTDGVSLYVVDGKLKRLDLSSGAVTAITASNIVLSQGLFPSDKFTTQSLSGDSNNLYAADGCAVYKISLATRDVTALAGAFNECGLTDGRGIQARFLSPQVISSDGRYLYVAEAYENYVRRVDSTSGDVITLKTPFPVTAGWSDGRYFYFASTSFGANGIYRLDPSTGTSAPYSDWFPVVSMWGDPTYLYAITPVCDVRRISRVTGAQEIIAGNYSVCYRDPTRPITPPADGVRSSAIFYNPQGITGDGKLLYVLDGTTIRSVNPDTGETHTIAGMYPISGTEDGVGSDAHFINQTISSPSPIWSDGTSVYVANSGIRRVILPQVAATEGLNVAAGGGAYWKTNPSTGSQQVSYATLQAAAGTAGLSGFEIISYSENGVTVSETAMPAATPVQQGRIYTEISGNVDTGIAVVNPNGQPATVSFYFTDASGVNFGAGSVNIPANAQVSAFLDASPFAPIGDAASRARTFTFSSSSPVSVAAIRTDINARSALLMTALPVAAMSNPSQSSILLPQFVDGEGWQTRVLLVNPTDSPIQGIVQIDSPVSYSIPPRSSISVATAGTNSNVQTGTVWVTPAFGSDAPFASTLFSYSDSSGVVISESGTVAVTDQTFRLLAERGAARTGIALGNPGSSAATVQFTLLSLSGEVVATSAPVNIDAQGRMALFVDEIPGLDAMPEDSRGVLTVSANVPITVESLRILVNETGNFVIAGLPVIPGTPSDIGLIFPQVATGAGYNTEFVMIGGMGPAQGAVNFFSQSGAAISLSVVR